MSVAFFVPGIPVGKGRPRITTFGGKARAYTPAKTVAYESIVASIAYDAMAGSALLEGPVGMVVTATFPIPASWTKARKQAAQWHTARPDGDNIVKAAADALNGVVWRDDSQVARCSFVKVYGDRPGLHVFVEVLA